MFRWGLTGGIASGKSSVARLFAACGIPSIDADALYHGLIAPIDGRPSPLAAAVGTAFAGTLRPDGTLDRRALGAHVFADAGARARLEAIAHPAVQAEAERALQALQDAGHRHALYDVPLLVERNLMHKFAGIVLVFVPEAVQRQRLAARDGLGAQEIDARLAAQLPLADKRPHARWVLDNAGSPEQTLAQVRAIVHEMQAM